MSGYARTRITSQGQRHQEATAAVFHRRASGVAAVAAGDLADQGKAEAGSGAGSAGAVERTKHILEFGCGYAGASVPYRYGRDAGVAADSDLRGRPPVARGVFQQVAQQPAQQARVTFYHSRRGLEGCVTLGNFR